MQEVLTPAKLKKLKGLLYIDSYFSSKQHKKSAQVMLLSNTLKNNKQAGFAEKKASHHLLSDKMLLHLPSWDNLIYGHDRWESMDSFNQIS